MKWNKKGRFIAFISVGILVCGLVTLAILYTPARKSIRTVSLPKYGPPYLADAYEAWADARLANMSLDEKLLQLLVLDMTDIPADLSGMENSGAVLLNRAGPRKWVNTVNYLQTSGKVPVWIGTEGLFNFGISADSIPGFPVGASITAFSSDSIAARYAEFRAGLSAVLGIRFHWSPSQLSLRNSAENPAVDEFRWHAHRLASLSYAYCHTLANHNMLAVATGFYSSRIQFRGQVMGSMITPATLRADSNLRYPFIALADSGLTAIGMYYRTGKKTAGEERPVDTLQRFSDFKGLMIGDVRQGIQDSGEMEKMAVMALANGADMVVIPAALNLLPSLKKQVGQPGFTQEHILKKVKKILMAKAWTGLTSPDSLSADTIRAALKSPYTKIAASHAFRQVITIARDENRVLPFDFLERRYTGHLSIGEPHPVFNRYLNLYMGFPSYVAKPGGDSVYFAAKEKELARFNTLVVSVPPLFSDSMPAALQAFLLSLRAKRDLVIVAFGNENILPALEDNFCTVVTYGDGAIAQQTAAEALFGGFPVRGRLPYTLAGDYCDNTGRMSSKTRVDYTLPEEAGISSVYLKPVDSMAISGISRGAYPGCQVFIARQGHVIYHKSFGNHTYDNSQPVRPTDMYDVASVTKVAATTLAAMRLYEERKLRLDTNLAFYLRDLDQSELKNVQIRDILVHQAGFPAVPPVFKYIKGIQKFRNKVGRPVSKLSGATLDSLLQYDPDAARDLAEDTIHMYAFSNHPEPEYGLKIAEGIYMRNDMPDSIWLKVIGTKLKLPAEFKYSDMSMYVMMRVIEAIAHTSLDQYVYKTFYSPMGLQTTGYKPAEKYTLDRIPPTENDDVFRKQQLHGYVHDPIAALLGGVSGHAGLFSSAHDLGILMQMVLNGGSYGGRTYFSPKTVALFTASQPGTHRGLGWDHQYNSGSPSMARSASLQTYGHLGFTGCCIWVDPAQELVYVFLSNRVYPVANNPKILGLNIRPNIHQAIYDAIVLSVKDTADHRLYF